MQTSCRVNGKSRLDLLFINLSVQHNEADHIAAVYRRVSRFINNDMNPTELDLSGTSEPSENLCNEKRLITSVNSILPDQNINDEDSNALAEFLKLNKT